MSYGDTEPSQFHGGEAPAPSSLAPPARVTFDRRELNRIFGLYGRKVAAGEWRDYAIDFLKDRAVFSVFRRAAVAPCRKASAFLTHANSMGRLAPAVSFA